MPGSDPGGLPGSWCLIAALRQAVIYGGFLDAIEPDGRIYHATDPANRLLRASELTGRD